MSKYPGEDLLITSYADIFYPTGDPIRFELSCYFYLYRHQTSLRGKLEVVNSPGQPNQDFFTGSLDNLALFQYSYDQPSRVLFDIQHPPVPPQEWTLSFKNSGSTNIRRMLVYFWKAEDALKVVEAVKTCVPSHLIRISGTPPQPTPSAEPLLSQSSQINPVVNRLERVALADQSYPGRSSSAASASTGFSFAPPPVQQDDDDDEVPPTPSAYNPAAPAKPEKRIHREKTPPPPEDGQPTVSGKPMVSGLSIPGQQSQRYGGPGGMSALNQPPMSPVGGGPGMSAFAPKTPLSPLTTSFNNNPTRSNAPLSPMITAFPRDDHRGPASPMQSQAPSLFPQSNSFNAQQLNQQQPQTTYGQPTQQPSASSIHSQFYKPSQEEQAAMQAPAPSKPAGQQGGLRLEDRIRQVDKGVGKFGKWLEKKVG